MAELQKPPQDPLQILAQIASLEFTRFNAEVAWEIGSLLRTRLRALTKKPACINISMANSTRLVFHAVTRAGAVPDNDVWIQRKRATVLRWGKPTWYFSRLYAGDHGAFVAKYELGGPDAETKYSIHGGGVPVLVRGVEGPVAVIVVSGLDQSEDHQVVVETVQAYLKSVAQ